MKNNGTFGLIDNLTVSYDGNRLLKVTDAAEALNYNGALDFNDGANADCVTRNLSLRHRWMEGQGRPPFTTSTTCSAMAMKTSISRQATTV